MSDGSIHPVLQRRMNIINLASVPLNLLMNFTLCALNCVFGRAQGFRRIEYTQYSRSAGIQHPNQWSWHSTQWTGRSCPHTGCITYLDEFMGKDVSGIQAPAHAFLYRIIVGQLLPYGWEAT